MVKGGVVKKNIVLFLFSFFPEYGFSVGDVLDDIEMTELSSDVSIEITEELQSGLIDSLSHLNLSSFSSHVTKRNEHKISRTIRKKNESLCRKMFKRKYDPLFREHCKTLDFKDISDKDAEEPKIYMIEGDVSVERDDFYDQGCMDCFKLLMQKFCKD